MYTVELTGADLAILISLLRCEIADYYRQGAEHGLSVQDEYALVVTLQLVAKLRAFQAAPTIAVERQ